MDTLVSSFSFWFALALAMGSLFFYLASAFWNRALGREDEDRNLGFNLALPDIGRPESLFSTALVSAGTAISTAVVFFLATGASYGWWLLLCPIMFATGNWLMLKAHGKINDLGYFEESAGVKKGVAGLIPYLGERLTGNRKVGWLLAFFSVINLTAVLVLELRIGVEIFGYLALHAFGVPVSTRTEFLLFALSIILLLGYVFVGGFRAVISSDVWQMKAMRWAVLTTLGSLVFKLSQSAGSLNLAALDSRLPWPVLCGFTLHVVLVNLFAPLSQEASWQRFRAFSAREIDFKKAIRLAMASAIFLWVGLIGIGFLVKLLTEGGMPPDSMRGVLESLRTLDGSWFPLFVFPVFTVAALSAMYSTADTSVSALLYLLEYRSVDAASPRQESRKGLPTSYHIAMLIIFLISIGVYGFVRLWFNLTILQLVFCAFSNLIVIAPTIVTATLLPPAEAGSVGSHRAPYVLSSLVSGFSAYWISSGLAIALGPDYLGLSLLAVAIGLLGAVLPLLPLWLNARIVYVESEVV